MAVISLLTEGDYHCTKYSKHAHLKPCITVVRNLYSNHVKIKANVPFFFIIICCTRMLDFCDWYTEMLKFFLKHQRSPISHQSMSSVVPEVHTGPYYQFKKIMSFGMSAKRSPKEQLDG